MNNPSIQDEKIAAGGIVIDSTVMPARVLIVHRQRYDDWSFPKGGVMEGESIEDAATREVMEETGVDCRINRKLTEARYSYTTRSGKTRPKVVHYFLMEPAGGSPHATGEEVDVVEWLDFDEAARRLTYERDKQLLLSVAENHR